MQHYQWVGYITWQHGKAHLFNIWNHILKLLFAKCGFLVCVRLFNQVPAPCLVYAISVSLSCVTFTLLYVCAAFMQISCLHPCHAEKRKASSKWWKICCTEHDSQHNKRERIWNERADVFNFHTRFIVISHSPVPSIEIVWAVENIQYHKEHTDLKANKETCTSLHFYTACSAIFSIQ